MRRLAWLSPLHAMIVLAYVVLLVPVLIVIGTSFSPASTFAFPPEGISLRWYRAFFSSEGFVHSFFAVSLVVALAVSILATLLGGLAAIGLVRFGGRASNLIETFFLMPIVVPGILLGAAFAMFYARIGFRPSLRNLFIAHLVIAIPYVVRTVGAGLAGVNLTIEEAAMNLGATPTQAFWKVTLPLLRSSLVSSAAFAFIVSFGDVNLALFISGPGTVTLPVEIFSQIQWQSDPTIAAASTLQILLVAIILAIVQKFFRGRIVM